LFIAPLLIPARAPGRLPPFAETWFWLGLAGEIAESPVVVAEPVLVFCAKSNDPEKSRATAAVNVVFTYFSNWAEWVKSIAKVQPQGQPGLNQLR
jgi:hypothetical protein